MACETPNTFCKHAPGVGQTNNKERPSGITSMGMRQRENKAPHVINDEWRIDHSLMRDQIYQ